MNDETDDFANDKEIQRLRKIQREQDELIEECVGIVSKELLLEEKECTDIASFTLFKSLGPSGIHNEFRSTLDHLDMEVYLVWYQWRLHSGKINNSGTDECFLGLLSLKKEYPLTCIFRESMRTIITDWFIKQDVDFEEQKKFSRQFHVISQDKDKLKSLLWNKPLDELADFPEMEVEISGKQCLFKVSGNPVNEQESIRFIHLAKKLAAILS
jgi:hypothetical protein